MVEHDLTTGTDGPRARIARRRAAPVRLWAWCAVGLFANAAHADVVNVDTGLAYGSFPEAYEAARAGETLELDDGVYALSAFALDKAVDLRAKNIAGAVIAGDGIATGYPVVISADITLSGLQFTAATAAFSLRDQAVTVRVEDAVFHGMNHGVTHQNIGGGTIGQIIINRATFFDLVEEAVYIDSGGAVIVNDAVFVDLPGLGLLLGDNEGADTLQVNNYVLADTPNAVNDPSLATLSGLVDGTPQLADPDNGYFALVAGSAGAAEGFGVGLPPAPRVTVTVTGNQQVVANGSTATAADNLTDFGTMHVSENAVHQFSIANQGYADDLSLTPLMGDFVRVTGDNEDQFSVLSQPPSGTIAPQASATFEVYYSPTAVGPHQTDIIFNNDLENPFVFRVTGTATNAAPVANDDAASVDEDNALTVLVLANDTDADGDALSVSAATLVSGQGTVTHQPSSVDFVPGTDFNGPASIQYVATDGHATDTATIDVTVEPVNDAPVAVADSASTAEDTVVVIDVLANDSDVDGDVLSISSATVQAGGGNVVVSGDVLEYTPPANSTAEATLDYVVTDGALNDNAQVTVQITAVNDPPVGTDDTATTAEDTPVAVDVLANDSDPDGDPLALSSAVVESGGGSLVIMGDVLEYTPPADSTEGATLRYVLSDGELSDTATLSVTITPVNDAPVAHADSATTVEDTPVVIDVLANDTDVDGDTLSISSASVPSGEGSVVVSGGVLEYTPPADQSGDVQLSYVVSDGTLTDTGTVLVTITSGNDAPVAVADDATTTEDTSVTIDVLANDSDPEGDALTLSSATVDSGGGTVIIMGGVLNYTPPADSTQDASLRYVVSDGELTDTGMVSVSITPVNDAPVANADSATVDEDTTVSIDVLANDSDVDGDALSIISATVESGAGTVVIRAGALDYTPAANSTAPATLRYVVSDGTLTDAATVTVTISPVNDAPVAAADSATTDEDTPVSIDVLANDSDVDGDALRIVSASVDTGAGSVAVNGGMLEFTPGVDDTAGASLSYVVSDGELNDTGMVSVSITSINDAPVANADSATVDEDTTVSIDVLANDSDVDGDALSISSATVESGGGTVVIRAGSLDYTPAANSTAPATLRYVVSDGTLTDAATVTVTISPVNDAPVAAADSAATDEDTTVAIDVLANDTDVDGDGLNISSAVVDSGDGNVAVNAGVLEFTPAANSTAGAILRYVVSDGSLSDTATVSVTVNPVNDAPVAAADDASTNEDTVVVIDVLANDSDVDSDALSISSAVVETGAGSVVVSAGTLEFTPGADDTAGATLRYVVSDGELTDTGTVSVRITPVNDAPVANADSASTDEDTTVAIDVLANDTDVDGDVLSIASAVVDSGNGSVAVNGGVLEYTPAANSTAGAILRYVVSDGALTDTATVSVSVAAVNDAPVANPDSATTAEDTAVSIDVLANDTEVEGDGLSLVSAAVQSGAGTVVVSGGLLEFTPAADDIAGALLSYVVSDGELTATGSVSVSVTAVNDAPVATADSATTDEDTVAVIDVLANDSDVDADVLSISSAVIFSGTGSVVINAGRLEYTPAADSTAPATLSYTISDGTLTDSATVSVTVTPVNDAPVAVADSATTDEDASVVIDVLANDGDVDGDTLTVTAAAVASGGGSVVISGGRLEFTPVADSTDAVALTYTVSDGTLADTGLVSVSITPVNDPPVARADAIRGHFRDAITIDVLANDGDIDSNNLFITAATAEQGSVAIVDSRLLFSLDGDWIPQTTIHYTVGDGELEASTSVTVDLNEYRAPLVIGTGEKIRRAGAFDEAAFSDIYSIVVGNGGQLFTADADVFRGINIQNKDVFDIIRNSTGHRDGSIHVAQFGNIEGLVYDSDNGFVYISEIEKGTIRRFDLRRDQVNTIRTGIVQPIGMALSNDGNTLYVIEHGKARVLSLDLLNGVDSVLVGNGDRGFADGIGEAAQINESVGLTVGADGTVYLADRGNSRLRAINPTTREITTLSSDFERLSDIVVRDANTLMVLDRNAGHIKRFDLATNTASVLESTVGQLVDPIAMDIDAAGTLYVVDFGSSQIKAFPVDAVDQTQSLPIAAELEQLGDTKQGTYFVRDVIGTGYRGAVTGLSRQANLNDPDQVALGGEDIIFHSNRQFTLMRTDLRTRQTVALFPDYETNTLVDATAYGLGVSRWGHIDGLTYSAADNTLYVFAGRNALFTIDLDDNSFDLVFIDGLVTGGDFTPAFDGTIYMVDTGANQVVQIDPETGAILDRFESRDGVTLSAPTDIDIRSNGDLYIANWGRREVVILNPGTRALRPFITRSGGFADGNLDTAVIGGVYGLEFGDNDVLYMADRLNHAVRLVDVRDASPIVRTMAGDGSPGVLSASGARFDNPTSLAVDFHGVVVVTDDGNNRIRLVGQNLSRPLSPFDAPVDVLGTNADGSPVEEGTLPLGDFPIVRDNDILRAAVAPIPMFLVDADERTQELGGVTYTTLEGDVTVEIPGGVNGSAFRVNGARLMAYSTEEDNDDGEIEANNAFFLRVSLRRFTASFLQSAAGGPDAISGAQLSAIVSVLPDVEMLIAYSDKNLDSTPVEDLPENLQRYFAGILNPRFGIPIFNDQGSINAFVAQTFNGLPGIVRDPLDFLGINQQFISSELGVDGGILTGSAVNNMGFLIDIIGFLFPALQPDIAKEGSDFAIPTIGFGVVLPGLSLPAFMQDAVASDPVFRVLGFEPDPGVQLRYFLNVVPQAFLKAELEGDAGVEGTLLVNLPNIINATALRDDPGAEPLEVRINLTAFLSGQLGGAGLADAEIGIKGSLQLVNYWKNPFGIQGIGFGDASILIGAQGAAGLALNNAGAGVDVFGGISGQFACLDDNDEILGLPSNAAMYLGFKVGVPPLPTGFGLEMSPGPGGMTFGDHVRCRVRLFNSVVLGLGDTLLSALPAGPEREAIQSIQESARGSFKEFERLLFTPLEFEPVRVLLDGVRFAGDLYLATPDVELPNRFGTVGLRSGGRLEIRENADAPWVAIADALIDIDFENGVLAEFGLNDYNVADLIVMENVQGKFDFKISNPLDATLNLTGRQKFFGLDSATSIDMSVRNGVTIDSRTAIDDLGEVEINAATTGSLDNWPPVGPGGGIDFAGRARFDLNPNHVADQVHGAVNGVLNEANSAYRDALNVLSRRTGEEQALQALIRDLEDDIRDRTDEINDRLRPGFNRARDRLSSARRHVSNVWSDIRYFERRKEDNSDRCSWPPHTWGHCTAAAYWWGREKAARALVHAANLALDIASAAVNRTESALDSALYDVARTLSPRLNAYRVAIVGLRTSRDLAAITVRALQAANNGLQQIGNALRDASNVRVHDASASIDSLFNVIGGLEPMRTDLDIQVLDLRCQARVDVRLPRVDVILPASNPFGSLTEGIFQSQSACARDRHEDTRSQRRVELRKQYFAKRAQGVVGVFSSSTAAGNDSVANAAVIDSALPVQLLADNTGAGTADGEFASELNDNTLWWHWQPPATGVYRIAASSDASDTTLQLHRLADGAPSADTLVAADFIPAVHGDLLVELDDTQTYLIGVGSQLGVPGSFALTIDAVHGLVVAPNDDVADAIAVTGLGGSTSQSNALATVEAGEVAGDDLPIHASLWWALDVARSGLFTVNTIGSDMDTVLRAYRQAGSGPVSAAKLVWQKTADDISVDPRSELTLFAEQGERIWFSVASKYTDVGRVEFNWQHTARNAAQLQGDQFAQPIVLNAPGTGIVRSNVGATTQADEPLHAGTSHAASLWYRFTAPDTGNYLFHTTNSGIDTALAIYTGTSLDSLTELASSDGAPRQAGLLTNIRYAAFRVNLEAGQTYHIAQAGIDEAEGDVVLNVQRFSLNDRFDDPITLAVAGGRSSADITSAQLEADEPDYAEILARDFLPSVTLASVNGVADAAGGAGVDVPVDAELLATLDTLHQEALADLQSRPAQHSLWYRYTATQAGDLVLDTLGSEPDTALVLFLGDTLDELVPLAWNDDTDNGTDSRIRHAVDAGQTYTVALVARSGGIVRLAARLVLPEQQTVDNDTPATATLLPATASQVDADNTYATANPAFDAVLSAQDGQRLWWRYDATSAGYLVADTQGSASDTLIEVYVDNFGTLELLTLNDNFHPALNSSRVAVPVVPGQRLWLAVDTLNGGVGPLRLNTRFEPTVAVPAHDRIEQAIVIPDDLYTVTASNTFAQHQQGEPFIGASLRPNSVWYQWTPASSGLATISTQGSEIDTLLGLYLGVQVSDLQLLESSGGETGSVVRAHVVAGASYFIAVAGQRDVQGSYTLSIAVADDGVAPAQNTTAGTATSVSGSQPQFAATLSHVLPDADTGSALVEASGQEASSRWWRWQAPADGHIEVSTEGSELVPQLDLYLGPSADRIVLLAADKGAGDDGAFSRVSSAVTAGQTYYIRISSPFTFQGEVNLSIAYIEAPSGPMARTLTGEQGRAAAAIVQAGTTTWTWTATDDGLAQFSLSRGDSNAQTLRVFQLGDGTALELDNVFRTTAPDALPTFQFVAERGARYRIDVTSTAALLGNAELHHSYVSRKSVDMDSPAGRALVTALKSFVTLTFDGQGVAQPTLAATPQTIAALLTELLTGSGIAGDQLQFTLGISRQADQVSTLADLHTLRFVAKDRATGVVVFSVVFDPDLSASAEEQHDQVLVDSPSFTELTFAGADQADDTIGVQMGRESFNTLVAQAFLSVRQHVLDTAPTGGEQTLLLGQTAYTINLDLYDGAGQRYPLETDQSVLRSVQVRLPVPTDVLLAWLGVDPGKPAAAQAAVDAAIRDGRLAIVRADTVDALLAGVTSPVDGDFTIDLSSRSARFSSDHFSVFALAARAPAPPVTDAGPVATVGDSSGALDWVTMWLLLLAIGGRQASLRGWRRSWRSGGRE